MEQSLMYVLATMFLFMVPGMKLFEFRRRPRLSVLNA